MKIKEGTLFPIIYEASKGDTKALECLIDLLAPIINSNSKVNNVIDDDLRSEIIYTLLLRLPKYKI